MDYRPLGRTGIYVSPMCLGAMMFGAFGNSSIKAVAALQMRIAALARAASPGSLSVAPSRRSGAAAASRAIAARCSAGPKGSATEGGPLLAPPASPAFGSSMPCHAP
jgi:hypothetical protein